MAETFANGDYVADGTIRASGDTDDLDMRMYQEDFLQEDSFFLRSSATHRPDAVSLDYLTCFTFGPKAFTDTSEGLTKYVWKIWCDTVNVYIARSNDTNTGWGDTQLLFTYAGEPIVELDAAFDQNGNVVVCAERHTGYKKTPYIWIYYFESFSLAYVFQAFDRGRNPRALLDDPDDFLNSDVLIFYVSLDKDQRVMYRMQRDRYLVTYNSPIVKELGEFYDYYLEDVARTDDNRIVIIYARRDKTRGEYQFLRWESAFYPFFMPGEGLTARSELLASTALHSIIRFIETQDASNYVMPAEYDGVIDFESLTVTAQPIASVINTPLYPVSPGLDVDPSSLAFIPDIDAITASSELGAGSTLVVAVIDHTLYDIDSLTAGSEPVDGTIVLVVIDYTMEITDESITSSSAALSGTLVTA